MLLDCNFFSYCTKNYVITCSIEPIIELIIYPKRNLKNLLWFDWRTYKASPHEILSKKLNDPTTNAQPLRFSPMRKFCMLTTVTC